MYIMVKTFKKKFATGTRKNRNRESSSLVSFQKEITVVFLEMLLMIGKHIVTQLIRRQTNCILNLTLIWTVLLKFF